MCTVILQIFFWSVTVSLLFQILFWPSFNANRYTQYDDPGDLIPYESDNGSSLGIYIEDLNKDAQPGDLDRYIGLYFAARNLTTKERSETYIAPKLCTEVMQKVP